MTPFQVVLDVIEPGLNSFIGTSTHPIVLSAEPAPEYDTEFLVADAEQSNIVTPSASRAAEVRVIVLKMLLECMREV